MSADANSSNEPICVAAPADAMRSHMPAARSDRAAKQLQDVERRDNGHGQEEQAHQRDGVLAGHVHLVIDTRGAPTRISDAGG